MRKFIAPIIEIVEVIVVAIGAVYLIKTFLVQPFLVSGASMAPNFSQGDYLVVDEVSYRFRDPARGEVVVFHYPKDESTYFIKRVIGVPGDRVVIADGMVHVANASHPDSVLEEPYLPSDVKTSARPGMPQEFVLENNQYLMLGDNRSYSYDSRDWGILERKEMVGLVRLRLWPLTDITAFAAPQYGFSQ